MTDSRYITFDEATQLTADKWLEKFAFWPNLLVSYAEQIQLHQGLPFAIDVAEHFANAQTDVDAIERLNQLSQMIKNKDQVDPSGLHETALEVWEASLMKKCLRG